MCKKYNPFFCLYKTNVFFVYFRITKSFVDFNGVVPEKYDVVGLTHKVQVEYGNVGVDFKYVPREGFGWMNASYQIGLGILPIHMRRALGTCTSPDIFFERLLQKQFAEAKEITQNGEVTAAITVIEPLESSIIINGSFNNHNLNRQDTSSFEESIITPENECESFIK